MVSDVSNLTTSSAHLSGSENMATSIKTSPQKCLSIVKDNVDNSTKNDSAIEKVLYVYENFTMQSYKINEFIM